MLLLIPFEKNAKNLFSICVKKGFIRNDLIPCAHQINHLVVYRITKCIFKNLRFDIRIKEELLDSELRIMHR